MLELKIKKRNILPYLTMVFSFMSSCSLFQGDIGTLRWFIFYYGNYVALLLFGLYVGINCKLSKDFKYLNFFIYIFCIPRILMLIYSSILWIVSDTNFSYITRGISNNLYQIIAYISGVLYCYRVKNDILHISLLAVITVYFLSFLIGFFTFGLDFLNAFNPLSDKAYIFKEYVELHELAYILGLYIIIYILSDKGGTLIRNKFLFLLSCICFIISWKRIGILSLTLALLYYTLFRLKGKKASFMDIKISGFIGFLLCIFYIYFIISGKFVYLMKSLKIDLMGRDIIYSYFKYFTKFSIMFFGYGSGFVSRQFDYTTINDLYNMISIKAVHNDLFKMYIEIGFIGYVLWIYWWLIKKPNLLYNKFGLNKALFCFVLICYSFVIYTTDNAESYSNYQMHLLSTMMYMLLYYREKNKIINRQNKGKHNE